MPTYDYGCENGHSFELFQSMKDEPLLACPECGGKAKRRIGTGAGFIFKGGGFYITENRSKEYKEKVKSESPVKSETPAKPADGGSSGGSGPSGGASGAGSSSGSGGTGGSSSGGAGGSSESGSGSSPKPKGGGSGT